MSQKMMMQIMPKIQAMTKDLLKNGPGSPKHESAPVHPAPGP
jgi:hypothetical protein